MKIYNTGFESFGIDSIAITQLNRMLRARFGEIPSTLFFTYKTLNELAVYFSENHSEAFQKSDSLEQSSETESVKTVFQSGTDKSTDKVSLNYEDAIAVIGISGRYPQAENLNQYWENLKSGKDCIIEIPEERWDYRKYSVPDGGKKTGMYCKWGGFLNDVDKFDPDFFNFSPLEAKHMDPHERIFIEEVWSCLEDSGYTRRSLSGIKPNDNRASVGVFAGVSFNNYQLWAAKELESGAFFPLNSQIFSVANRVSFFFNFSGPSLALDTACSSSLVAVHLACESIRRGECMQAVAGGVNLSLHPTKYMTLCNGQFASSDGRCRSFGEGGDGYVPSEGAGAILLKPLKQAIADGDHVYAKILSSAVNHGGKTYGYSVPNPTAQTEVIVNAIKKSGISPETISYVEAHGTGTSLGDPIEIQSLTDAYAQYTDKKQFCAIGSVKSNIGHGEAAAGIAQLTKVILQMKNGELVPSLLHAPKENPNIDFEKTPFYVQKTLEPWKRPVVLENGNITEYPLRAGISSFGVGGVNAHLIVEEYRTELEEQQKKSGDLRHSEVVVLSAKHEQNLRQYAERMMHFFTEISGDENSHMLFKDAVYTLQIGREAMNCRLAFMASDAQEAAEKLNSFLKFGEKANGIIYGTAENLKTSVSTDEINDMEKLAGLWVRGNIVHWGKFYSHDCCRRRISMPTYPFSRERYWIVDHGLYNDGVPSSRVVRDLQKADDEILTVLANLPMSERESEVCKYLQKTIGEILAFSPDKLPDMNKGFFDMGMDSIQSVSLFSKIERDLSLELYSTVLFDYTNIRGLAQYILSMIRFETKTLELPQKEKSAEESTYDKIYYSSRWEKCDAEAATADTGDLLIFDTDEFLCEALKEKYNARPILIKPGTAYRKTGDSTYEINPGSDEDYEALLKTLKNKDRMPDKVVYYWAKGIFSGAEKLAEQLDTGIYPLFRFTQKIMQLKIMETLCLLYIYPGGEDGIQPHNEAIGAFARVVSAENPKFSYCTAAISHDTQDAAIPDPGRTAEIVMQELGNHKKDIYEVYYDDKQRWVKKVKEIKPVCAGVVLPSMLKNDGVYIITGGAGGLGSIFTRYISEKVNAKIVLCGRSSINAEKIAELRDMKSEIIYIKADISNQEDVSRLINNTKERFGKISGIIHTAGIICDSFIVKKTADEMKRVFAPKIFGTVFLDDATKNEILDFFLLFSSIAAVMGNPGQMDYSYANCFMNCFAMRREQLRLKRQRTGKTIAVNWPLWRNGGMQIDKELEKMGLNRIGISLYETDEGINDFEKALCQENNQFGVVNADRRKLGKILCIEPEVTEDIDTVRIFPGSMQVSKPEIKPTDNTAAKLETVPDGIGITAEIAADILNMKMEDVENELAKRLAELGM